jgi:hypothetical protein
MKKIKEHLIDKTIKNSERIHPRTDLIILIPTYLVSNLKIQDLQCLRNIFYIYLYTSNFLILFFYHDFS